MNSPCEDCRRDCEVPCWKVDHGLLVEVMHGRWIDNGIPDSVLSGCSACGFTCGAYTFNYCPNCGAKMDGEEKR